MFGYGNSYSQWLYELPSNLEKASGYAKPIDNVFYEPQHHYDASSADEETAETKATAETKSEVTQ